MPTGAQGDGPVMGFSTLVVTSCAAVAMMLAGVCAFVWLLEWRNLASLMACILGVAAALTAYTALGTMHAATPAEFGEWLRWMHVPLFFALVSLALFVHYYLGTGAPWLMWVFIVARSVVLVVNFLVRPNFNFSGIVRISPVTVLGERLSVIDIASVRTEWQMFATASLILLAVYLINAVTQGWLKGDRDSRRKALVVGLGIAVPFICTVVFASTELLVTRVLPIPLLGLVWLLTALAMMSYQIGYDVIVTRRQREDLAEARNRLAQVERVGLMGQLASSLSHQLSQPLTATGANVEAGLLLLKAEKPDSQELREILHDIGTEHRRAAEIIDHMRRFFKQRKIEMQSLSVEDVMQEAIVLVRSEMSARNVALSVVVEPGLPHVYGDRVHLSQVLLNLLMNSINALQSYSCASRQIVVGARVIHTTGEVEIAVQDSGPGIPAAVIDQLFKPFFTTKSDGTGIGLALSRTIIEAHGGRLWFDEAGQDGATFRFTLRQALSTDYSADKIILVSPAREGVIREAPA